MILLILNLKELNKCTRLFLLCKNKLLHYNVHEAGARNKLLWVYCIFKVILLDHHQHLSYTPFCDYWYRHICKLLTPEQKQCHVGVCKDLHQQAWMTQTSCQGSSPLMRVASPATTQKANTVIASEEFVAFNTHKGMWCQKHNQEHAGAFFLNLQGCAS